MVRTSLVYWQLVLPDLLIASFLVGVVSPDLNWRIQFIIPSVTSTIVLIVVWKLFPESPRWLEAQGRFDEANELLDDIEARGKGPRASHSNRPRLRQRCQGSRRHHPVLRPF